MVAALEGGLGEPKLKHPDLTAHCVATSLLVVGYAALVSMEREKKVRGMQSLHCFLNSKGPRCKSEGQGGTVAILQMLPDQQPGR